MTYNERVLYDQLVKAHELLEFFHGYGQNIKCPSHHCDDTCAILNIEAAVEAAGLPPLRTY